MGLYGGETVEDIHNRKGLKENQRMLDYMESNELIANLFRISQAEQKLKKDGVDNPQTAKETHYVVGKEVRATIERVGGTMPEYMPTPIRGISEVEREQLKKSG